MIWLILGPYVFCYLIITRLIAGHLAWRMHFAKKEKWPSITNESEPTGDQWFGAIVAALLGAAIWPLVLVFVKVPFKIGAERKAEQMKLKARISELEREAGIR